MQSLSACGWFSKRPPLLLSLFRAQRRNVRMQCSQPGPTQRSKHGARSGFEDARVGRNRRRHDHEPTRNLTGSSDDRLTNTDHPAGLIDNLHDIGSFRVCDEAERAHAIGGRHLLDRQGLEVSQAYGSMRQWHFVGVDRRTANQAFSGGYLLNRGGCASAVRPVLFPSRQHRGYKERR